MSKGNSLPPSATGVVVKRGGNKRKSTNLDVATWSREQPLPSSSKRTKQNSPGQTLINCSDNELYSLLGVNNNATFGISKPIQDLISSEINRSVVTRSMSAKGVLPQFCDIVGAGNGGED